MELLERCRGSMLGLAVGDALGTNLEFKAPGSFEPIRDIIGGGPFNLPPGAWTDDTSMALALAESLVTCQGFDPRDQMNRYLRWYREGYLSSTGFCFDIGNTVRAALERFEKIQEPYCGSTDPHTAGNGSIMRLAPVILFYAKTPLQAIYFAGESSKTTHGALEAVDACRYLGALMTGALKGVSKEELLSCNYSPVKGLWEHIPLTPKIALLAVGSYKTKQPPEIQGTGYVIQSLEAALWCFYNSSNFKHGALLAANLGDDADTTAAIYGQLAGAFYGEAGIPQSWINMLVHRQYISELAEKLFRANSHAKN